MSKLKIGLLLVFSLSLATWSWLSRGPDFTVQFERTVQSPLSIEELGKAFSDPAQWPSWHFNLVSVDSNSPIVAGSLVLLKMEPPKKEWKRFELQLRVREFEPGKKLSVEVDSETKGRLQKVLREVSWEIELLPQAQGQGTLLRGRAQAKTASPRGRLMARLAPRVVMNQVFYPDLESLADLNKRKHQKGEHDGRLLPF